jgi:hypothetical protein
MIKHIWSVLCRRSIVDSDSNNISLNEIFEQLAVNLEGKEKEMMGVKQINVPIEFEVVNMWIKEDKEKQTGAELEVDVINPKGVLLKTFPQKFEMPSGMKRMRTRLKVMGLVVDQSGDYIFKVRIKEQGNKDFEIVAEIPLEVNISKKMNKEIASKPN